MADKTITVYRNCSRCQQSTKFTFSSDAYLQLSRAEADDLAVCDLCKASHRLDPSKNPNRLVDELNKHAEKGGTGRMVFRTDDGKTACCWCYRNKADMKTRIWRRPNAKATTDAKDVWYPICEACKKSDDANRKEAVKEATKSQAYRENEAIWCG